MCILVLGAGLCTLKAEDKADSTKLTLSTVYSDAKEGLKGLGDALKVGAEHVYVILVKQQVVYSITYLVIVVLVLIGGRVTYSWSNKMHADFIKENSNHEWGESPADTGLMVIAFVLWVGGGCTAIAVADDIVAGFVNPEYGAIKEIMNFVKR